MIGEIDVCGVFLPVLLAWTLIALMLTAALRRILVRIGFWHRPLVDLSLLIIILAAVSNVMPRLVLSWIVP